MNIKWIGSFFTVAALCSTVFSQTADYKKFRISVRAGMDYSLGESVSDIESFSLPSAPKGLNASTDAVYFFTKNYGLGIKNSLFHDNIKQSTSSEYEDVENKYKYSIIELCILSFKEQTYIIGPSIYTR